MDVVRVPVLGDVRDRPPPLVLDARVQRNPVGRQRHLVRHEAHRQAAAEVVADEVREPLAGQRRVVDERVPDRVEVLAAVGASERQRQRLVGGVVVDRTAGPDAVLTDELRAGGEVGRPVAVERRYLVGTLAGGRESRRRRSNG